MKINLSSYLNNLSLILLGLFFVAFPFLFTTLTTDNFSLPKQFALIAVSIVSFIFLSGRFLSDKIVRLRRTPFDFPLLAFVLVILLSSIFAVNRAESLVSSIVLLFAASFYFLIVNFAKTKRAVLLLTLALVEGGVLLSIFYILSFFKVYILPYSYTQSQIFTPLGSLLDQAIYLSIILVLTVYFAYNFKKTEKINFKKATQKVWAMAFFSVLKLGILLAGLVLTVYALVKLQQPLILPFTTGFQVGFATISQDTQRFIVSFLLGSGFGTFATDFSRFKLSVFNQSPLWNLTFFRSSSFVLELLATTGILGAVTFLNLIYQVLKRRPLFFPIVLLILISFVLPLSAVTQVLFFVLLGIYASLRAIDDKKYFDVELALVTLKSGLVTVAAGEKREVRHGLSRILPFFVFVLILILTFVSGLFTIRYALANKIFQESIIATSQNKGSDAYTKQSQAILLVSYNDSYQRVFSQTNLALANSLSSSTPKGSSPSAQTQQTIYTLIQQSINSARVATNLGPLTAVNWQNLSGVYRSLIGFGKNADAFSILAAQQAISLDPTNPQEYINLGGLYYQLQLWDKAAEQFRAAINLKPDLANAYYNLAHALQQKGDLNGALEQLETVKNLVKNDSTNLKKVEVEIDALKKGLAAPSQGTVGTTTTLPPQNPPVAIPAPGTPKPSPSPSPATAPLGTTPTPTPIPTK